MRADRGSVTIWILGLVMVVLGLGGLVLDMWRVLDEKHRLEVIADAAAVAGAGALDEAHYRQTGEIALEPAEARQRAVEVVASAGPVESTSVTIDPGEIRVVLAGSVELGLLGLLLPEEDRVLVRGRATAAPRVYP